MATRVPRISASELRARLEREQPATLIDARNARDWSQAARMLPEALRVPADAIETHLPSGRMSEPIIVYCT